MNIWPLLFGGKASQNKLIHFSNRIKTYIGKVTKGFDFLGFNCSPTGIRVSDAALSRRDAKVARLYEQGASKKRIGRYLAKWLIWVGAAGSGPATASIIPCLGQTESHRTNLEVPGTYGATSFFGCVAAPSLTQYLTTGLDSRFTRSYYYTFFSPKDLSGGGGDAALLQISNGLAWTPPIHLL